MPQNTLVFLTFSVRFSPNHKIWVCCSCSVYSVWKLTQLVLQYTVPGSSQVMLLQFITINCFILEQTILMRQSGFKLIQKRHNWKVSSLFVLFLLTRFYDMTRLQIALFMINWQLCKLYMLKAICCTSCSGKKPLNEIFSARGMWGISCMGPAMSVPFQASHGCGGRGEKRPSDPKTFNCSRLSLQGVRENDSCSWGQFSSRMRKHMRKT